MAPTDPPPLDRPLCVLFVCSGNTCRSPLAEVLARKIARDLGFSQLECRSAGTSTVEGFPASEGSKRAACRHGLDLEDHGSTPLSPELVEWADLVLAMASGHLDPIHRMGGLGKSALLGAFAGGPGRGDGGMDHAEKAPEVPDPFGGDDGIYENTYQTLERYVGSALKRLAEKLGIPEEGGAPRSVRNAHESRGDEGGGE